MMTAGMLREQIAPAAMAGARELPERLHAAPKRRTPSLYCTVRMTLTLSSTADLSM